MTWECRESRVEVVAQREETKTSEIAHKQDTETWYRHANVTMCRLPLLRLPPLLFSTPRTMAQQVARQETREATRQQTSNTSHTTRQETPITTHTTHRSNTSLCRYILTASLMPPRLVHLGRVLLMWVASMLQCRSLARSLATDGRDQSDQSIKELVYLTPKALVLLVLVRKAV